MALQSAQVSGVLPTGTADGGNAFLRVSNRRDLYVTPVGVGFYGAVAEGGYYRAVNATPGTGLAMRVQAAFSATASVLMSVRNTDTAGSNSKSVYPDYVRLICTAAGTGTTSCDALIVVDSSNRVSVAGTALAAVNVNSNYSAAGIALPAFGIITATAEGAGTRRVSRMRLKSAALAVGDIFMLNFGSNGTGAADLGPVSVGPGGTMLLHLWTPGVTAAPSFEVEAGWWER